jgi:hypothetical protein
MMLYSLGTIRDTGAEKARSGKCDDLILGAML